MLIYRLYSQFSKVEATLYQYAPWIFFDAAFLCHKAGLKGEADIQAHKHRPGLCGYIPEPRYKKNGKYRH